jgi:hypothetical protein
MIIYVVCEMEGGHLVKAFTDEQDARSHLYWEEATGGLTRGYYTIKEVDLKGLTT